MISFLFFMMMMLGWNQGRLILLGLINLILGSFLLRKSSVTVGPVSGWDNLLWWYTACPFCPPFPNVRWYRLLLYRGTFNDYVDTILHFFDHLPPLLVHIVIECRMPPHGASVKLNSMHTTIFRSLTVLQLVGSRIFQFVLMINCCNTFVLRSVHKLH